MEELWQLYSENGQPISGKGATKSQTRQGLLHAAAHVWIWRASTFGPEILVQKRATNKPTWPGLWDISAAGHIDLGETPEEAAIRETTEEIGLKALPKDLKLIGKHRMNQLAAPGIVENEFRYLYLLELRHSTDFKLSDGEVEDLKWLTLAELKKRVTKEFVPQGDDYFRILFSALDAL